MFACPPKRKEMMKGPASIGVTTGTRKCEWGNCQLSTTERCTSKDRSAQPALMSRMASDTAVFSLLADEGDIDEAKRNCLQ